MNRDLAPAPSLRALVAGLMALAAAAACRDATAPESGVAALAGPSPSVTAGTPALETFYGPERFTRGRGAPETFTRQIPTARFEAPFVLHVRSGNASGANRVSSATVRLDGSTVLGPAAFNQQQGEWSLPATLGSSATLSVSLASAPGSYLAIWIEGKRSATLFCEDGRAGAYTTLAEAIAATPMNGTLVVCDGTHDVDSVVVNKPLTIRSLNPGGATLGDGDPNVTGLQTGRPAISIDGVLSGLVRIVDVRFASRGRALIASGTFDKVEIDSARFYGRDSTTSVSIEVFESSVPGARVDITNSDFDHVGIGVFPVRAIETNVRHNTFANFHQGGVIFSGFSAGTSGLTSSYSFGSIEDNVFRSCGQAGCIRALAVGNVVIARNHLQAKSGVARFVGLWARRFADAPNRSPIVIEDNEIEGAPIPAGTPTTTNGWTLQSGINLEDAAGVANVVRRNRITDAYTGILISGDVDARDNVVSGGAYGFRQMVTRAVIVSRNDFTSLVSSFQAPSSGGDYRCNWWGSASGPHTPPGNVAAGTYAPWATQPIAGTDVGCDPAATVATVRVCSTAIYGGPMTAATFAQAYNLVAPGGTISFCAGTHLVSNASIGKPLTVTSESGAMATLDGGSGGPVFVVGNVTPAGAVNVSGLRFTGGTFSNVFVGSNAGTVNVTSNEFHPPQTGPYGGTVGWRSGLQLGGTGIGSVNVEGNTFIGGDVGFHINSQSGTPTLRGNTFQDQNNSSIHIAGPKPGPIVIEGNTFRGCGPNWCLFTQHVVTAVGNTVEIPTGRSTYAPFRIDNFDGGMSVLTDNVLTGALVGTDRSLDANYSIRGPAIQVYGAGEIERDRVSYAFNGIGASNAALTGSENVIEHTFAPFSSGGSPSSSSISMTRNDLLDYVVTLDAPWAFTAVSLPCNYWGSASGPMGITGSASWYEPSSAHPIASQPAVVCP